jgi:serine/threonine protein kinase
MIFDYYNGGELFFHLQKLHRFSEDLVRFYSSQIFLALNHLHKSGIIYRDLKPENIVLDEFGDVKIIDFGLAQDEISDTKKCNQFCGTNEYIPPEVIKGEKYSFNFDWWGFGVLLYEMLFGVPPFIEKSGNKGSLFKKICSNEPNFGMNGVCLSKDAEDLLKSLLCKDLSQRIKPDDIPKHPFYTSKGINFEDVLKGKVKAPYKPKVRSCDDFSNIDPCFLRESLISPKNDKKLKYDIDHKKFAEF